MAQRIPLQAIPNQSFTTTLEGARWEISIKDAGGVMVADITRSGTLLLQGQRLVAGTPLIPYQHLEAGNFIIITENEEYPRYQSFGASQFLIYNTVAEMGAIRGA